MSSNSPLALKYKKGKPNLLVEVANSEKQLWTFIHSEGLLCSDVQELYHRVCASYEKIILNDYDQTELQDVEYSLWKLHYKHIDEFRKSIKRSSGNLDNTTSLGPQGDANWQRSNDNHIEGFKSFLSEAIEFYHNLIVKIKRYYGLPEESSFCKIVYSSIETKKLQKCQFLCHRFLVCLGDLARYKEQYEKFGAREHNWSVAATHYLEATLIWPDSGNPQNQLAVLATYVGDDFLALYHCVRSLAVKEPFPDAWNNLILLFERNRSSDLQALSNEAHFDFLKPSEKSRMLMNPKSSDGILNCKILKVEHDCFMETNLWKLIIRTISFFLLKSSLEDFPCTFASTMRELDTMMELDDTKLKSMLESYQLLDSARSGPFRALQVVSIFIFIFENQINSQEIKESKDKNNMQHVELTQWALCATFIFMGRLVDRCLKSNPLASGPILPAVLVFVEWLVSMLDVVEAHGSDDKSRGAMSYFFSAFVGLLKQLHIKGEVSLSKQTALWEDYELRGFAPISYSHESLDFSTHYEHMKGFEAGKECRADRIINAAMKIANRSNGSRNWIIYDKAGTKFWMADPNVNPYRSNSEVELNGDLEVKELHQSIAESTKEYNIQNPEENVMSPSEHGKSVAVEDEEVIVFKPLTRYNSAPLYTSINAKDPESPKDKEEQTIPPDECLRRATSLLIAQNQSHGDALAFHSDITFFRPSKPINQQEHAFKETGAPSFFQTSSSGGPPSLSSWVFNRASGNGDREKGRSDTSKPCLSPIEEIASASLSVLSISQTEDSFVKSGQNYASSNFTSYSAPLPSAPLLPEDATWFDDFQPSFSNFKSSVSINRADSFSGASQLSGYPSRNPTHGHFNYGAPICGFMDGYPPFREMSSSEWLRQYRENHNLERTNSHSKPLHFLAPWNTGNFHNQEASMLNPLNQWQVPLASSQITYTESPLLHPVFPQVHTAGEHTRDKLFPGYQRPTPYGCGVTTDFGDEPQPLLEYLKEKEWLLQRDPTLRGPTYMGN